MIYIVIDSDPPSAASFDVEKIRALTCRRQAGGLWRHGRARGVDIVIDSNPPGAASFDEEKINNAHVHEGRHEPERGGGRGSQRKHGDITIPPGDCG